VLISVIRGNFRNLAAPKSIPPEMKILFLTSRFPFPLEKGDKLRAFYQIAELSRNHEVILASVSDEVVKPEHMEVLKRSCSKIIIHTLSKAKQITNLGRALINGNPFQVEYFFSAEFKNKIQKIVDEHKPDAIFCQLVRMAEYVKDIKGIPKTLDYQDAFSKGYERQAKRENFFKKIPVLMEWKRMLAYEKKIFGYFENKIIISEQDRELISHPDHQKIEVIPNGVDFNYYSPQLGDKKYDLIFSGNMNYPPNIESAIYIAEQIIPKLKKVRPDTTLVIAGANPAPEVRKLNSGSIYVTGWVDDIREPFSKSRIHLAPMLISIGLQNKILQAMAMKIPCIVSSQANNAIHAPIDDCLLIADTPEAYVEKIMLLLNDQDLYNRIADNAYRFVRNNFDWTAMNAKLESILFRNNN
jgi:sugar transferase (PEP-CTERM/EpsH1 system associated)